MYDLLRFAGWSLGASLLLCAGCSSEMSDAIVEAARAQSHPSKPASELVNPEVDHEDVKPVSLTTMPSPDRTNPFEMSGEFEETPIGDAPSKKREIRVLGFIELDAPAAMLSLDGRTQIFKVGETFDKITVQEIQPPRVRINYDGVTWQASIFDPRSN
jgi:hypothetical protein